ncbi:hypothetical protein [Rhodococcoides yunnanense]|uniref:hypothetical protein n=1 Tax=Rhodococcoides yunnanense TaxID=278209 RepID=UPI000935427F|nr:hypothetical protein [Rhodococcus yunnanensis]
MNALTSTSFKNSTALEDFTALEDSFADLLPRELRSQALGMSWTAFTRRFGAASGPIRLGSWDFSAARAGRTTFDATFGIGTSIHSATATTYGPIDALTSMLYDAGFHIEITSFHQQQMPAVGTTTFVLAEFDGTREWAMASGSTSAESSIKAIIGAANMLHG